LIGTLVFVGAERLVDTEVWIGTEAFAGSGAFFGLQDTRTRPASHTIVNKELRIDALTLDNQANTLLFFQKGDRKKYKPKLPVALPGAAHQ
jgi:hypothetical protein